MFFVHFIFVKRGRLISGARGAFEASPNIVPIIFHLWGKLVFFGNLENPWDLEWGGARTGPTSRVNVLWGWVFTDLDTIFRGWRFRGCMGKSAAGGLFGTLAKPDFFNPMLWSLCVAIGVVELVRGGGRTRGGRDRNHGVWNGARNRGVGIGAKHEGGRVLGERVGRGGFFRFSGMLGGCWGMFIFWGGGLKATPLPTSRMGSWLESTDKLFLWVGGDNLTNLRLMWGQRLKKGQKGVFFFFFGGVGGMGWGGKGKGNKGKRGKNTKRDFGRMRICNN